MASTPFAAELKRIVEECAVLTQPEARALMQMVLDGEASELELAALLAAFAARGETAPEIAGFAEAMRASATPIPLTDAERERLVDTCGTGGVRGNINGGRGTFNISTAAALTAAAAGVLVAKHGNRGITSRCGSADVLEALGVPVSLPPEKATQCLRQTGFIFLHAPQMHPAMKRVQPVRKALPFRTMFNFLGPMTNPAGARRQVMGVYSPELVPLAAQALALLGARHAFVVHGAIIADANAPGQDELALTGPSLLAEVRDGMVHERTISPEELGLTRSPIEALAGGDAAENAAILRSIFSGERGPDKLGPRRDVVVLNAAAAMVAGGAAADLKSGAELAAMTIDSGAVLGLIDRLKNFQ
jgi:anthranilate phosphoribosyltransferase